LKETVKEKAEKECEGKGKKLTAEDSDDNMKGLAFVKNLNVSDDNVENRIDDGEASERKGLKSKLNNEYCIYAFYKHYTFIAVGRNATKRHEPYTMQNDNGSDITVKGGMPIFKKSCCKIFYGQIKAGDAIGKVIIVDGSPGSWSIGLATWVCSKHFEQSALLEKANHKVEGIRKIEMEEVVVEVEESKGVKRDFSGKMKELQDVSAMNGEGVKKTFVIPKYKEEETVTENTVPESDEEDSQEVFGDTQGWRKEQWGKKPLLKEALSKEPSLQTLSKEHLPKEPLSKKGKFNKDRKLTKELFGSDEEVSEGDDTKDDPEVYGSDEDGVHDGWAEGINEENIDAVFKEENNQL
jgi:hypothetical protein